MTTERIEVLAVMDRLLECVSVGVDADDPVRQLIEAGHEGRAALAELIEASEYVANYVLSYSALTYSPTACAEAGSRLQTALARVGAP